MNLLHSTRSYCLHTLRHACWFVNLCIFFYPMVIIWFNVYRWLMKSCAARKLMSEALNQNLNTTFLQPISQNLGLLCRNETCWMKVLGKIAQNFWQNIKSGHMDDRRSATFEIVLDSFGLQVQVICITRQRGQNIWKTELFWQKIALSYNCENFTAVFTPKFLPSRILGAVALVKAGYGFWRANSIQLASVYWCYSWNVRQI